MTPVDEAGEYERESDRVEVRSALDHAATVGRFAARCTDPRTRDKFERYARKLSAVIKGDTQHLDDPLGRWVTIEADTPNRTPPPEPGPPVASLPDSAQTEPEARDETQPAPVQLDLLP